MSKYDIDCCFMIKYIDTFSVNSFHAQINACLLKMLVLSYPNEVVCYSSVSNRREIEKLIEGEENIRWEDVYVVGGKTKYAVLYRYIFSAIRNVKFLFMCKNNEILFFNYNNPFSIRLVNYLNKFLRRKILIVCHGELEMLYPHDNSGILAKIISKLVNNFFLSTKSVSSNITFCVLGDSILNNLKAILSSRMLCHFQVIEHPYIYKKIMERNREDNKVLKFGVVGSFSFAKGGRNFIQLVEELNCVQNISFSVTGSISEGIDDLKRLGVSLPKNDGIEQIPIEEFSERICNLDYILFLYPTYSYKLTASGAIMDAIKWGIPIISIRNDYFENVFAKYGRFGYLVEDLSEMKNLMLSLLNSKGNASFDFDSVRRKSSPESISANLKEIVDKMYC